MKANEFRCSCCNKIKDVAGQEIKEWDKNQNYGNKLGVTVCRECAKVIGNKSVMEVVK